MISGKEGKKREKIKNSASEIWPFHTYIKLHVFLLIKVSFSNYWICFIYIALIQIYIFLT